MKQVGHGGDPAGGVPRRAEGRVSAPPRRSGGAGAPQRAAADATAAPLPPAAHRSPGRGVIIQTAFFGDVVLTTPLIRRAAERHAAPVDVVMLPAAVPVLQNHPCIRDVIPYDKHGKDRGLLGFLRLVRLLRRRRYAVAYLAQSSLRSARWRSRPAFPRRIGFRDRARRVSLHPLGGGARRAAPGRAAARARRRRAQPARAGDLPRAGGAGRGGRPAPGGRDPRRLRGAGARVAVGLPSAGPISRSWPACWRRKSRWPWSADRATAPTRAPIRTALGSGTPVADATGRALAARRRRADPPRARAGVERLRARAPRLGGGHGDGRDLRPDGAGVRLRGARAPGRAIVEPDPPGLPAVQPPRPAGLPPRPPQVHARDPHQPRAGRGTDAAPDCAPQRRGA